MMQNDGAGFLSGAAGGFFGSLGATAWGGAGGEWKGIAGKYANSPVGTIAFGALSGGVGAELSGGNFWQGAITGGIVAGLNDVMHAGKRNAFKTKLLGYFDNTGINPDDPAPKDISSVNKLKSVMKQLSTLFSKNGNPTITVGEGDHGNRGQVASTYKDNTMTIWGAAFESYYYLAFTMFHEGTHAYFNLMGLSTKWNKDYFDCGSDVNEYNAYRLGFEIAPDMIVPMMSKYNDSMNGNYYGNGNMGHWEAAFNLFK